MTEKIKLNPGPIDDTVLYEQKHHICNIIWGSTLLDEKKDIRNYNRFPVIDDHRVLYLLNVAGFYGLYSLGYRKVDNHLITALIERWRPETSTFHFSIGELTMTLQDIEVLGGVKVDGNALVSDESGFTTTAKHALVTDLLGIVTRDTFTDDGMIKFSWLCYTFNPQSVNKFSSVDYIMRVTRACMLLIIESQYLQDDKGVGVPVHYLAYMRDFDICGQYSWGSAILGYTYRSLTKAALIDKRGKSKRGVIGALQLLQYWAWSRFRFLVPKYSADDTPPEGFPSYPFGRRLARCKMTYTTGIPFHSVRVFRDLFDMVGHRQAPKKGVKPAVAAKKKTVKVVNPLFEKRPKQFGIGGSLPPKKDLHRFVKWPKVVQIQRKRRILNQRLKVPPPLNQFTKTLDKNLATGLFKMLLKYRPEDRAAKKERLLKRAQAETEGKTVEAKKPIVVKYGLNHVTYLIEQNKAQLVVIAHDVDPIELVVWLPALCRKMEIPYCIVKGKARLGTIVHQKTASVLCLTTVKNEDKMDFSRILEAIKANFNDKYEEYRKKWGGGIMGSKSQAKTKAKERVIAKEAAQRLN